MVGTGSGSDRVDHTVTVLWNLRLGPVAIAPGSDIMANLVTIGFRAKTGRAVGVVLGGIAKAPIVLRKFEIRLTVPKIPATFQPYHAVMELPWDESQKAARKSVRAIETVARRELAKLIRLLRSDGFTVTSLGVVGSKDRELSSIGNYHIRAHAAEGILFRRVLEQAAEANGLKAGAFADRELEKIALADLKTSANELRGKLTELGRALPPPWRADEKQAALAAWLMLHK